LICNIPVSYFHGLPIFFKFPRLYLLVALFMLIIYSSGIIFNGKVFAACIAFFLLPACFKIISPEEQDNSSYVLSKEKYLLMYDYEIRDGKLLCMYWSDTGTREEEVDMPGIVKQQTNEFIVDHNKVYYKGEQI